MRGGREGEMEGGGDTFLDALGPTILDEQHFVPNLASGFGVQGFGFRVWGYGFKV